MFNISSTPYDYPMIRVYKHIKHKLLKIPLFRKRFFQNDNTILYTIKFNVKGYYFLKYIFPKSVIL